MWLEVMENNPSDVKGFNKPVETVSWWQALEFCNKLSEKYGLEPVYDLSRSEQEILMIKELGKKIVSPEKVNFKNTEGFRLPTEIEWEWFAKGGQKAIEQGTFEYKYSGSIVPKPRIAILAICVPSPSVTDCTRSARPPPCAGGSAAPSAPQGSSAWYRCGW